MSVQIGRLDAAGRKSGINSHATPATILAVMAGVLWSLGLLQYAQWHGPSRGQIKTENTGASYSWDLGRASVEGDLY